MNAMKKPEEKSMDSVVTLKRASGHREKAAAVYRRISVNTDSADNKGARLLHVINRTMAKFNHTIDDVADILEVSSVYLRAIGKGERSFAKVDRDILRKIAEYVELPVAQVFLLSDTLSASDFYYANSIEKELGRAYESMTTHPMWAGLAPAPEEWAATPIRGKILLVNLYEAATSQRFLTSASVPAIQSD